MTTVQDILINANPNNRKDKVKNSNGSVIFPGAQLGFDIGAMRDFVKVQKRSKGFIMTTVVGTKKFDLDISGDGVFFLGLNVTSATPTTLWKHNFKLMFNEEQLFADNNGKFICPELNPNKDMEFFPYPRPMSGNDSITLTIESTEAVDLFVNTYYI